MRLLLFLLQAALAQPTHRVELPVADSAILRMRVDTAVRVFQRQWSDAWTASQEDHPFLGPSEFYNPFDRNFPQKYVGDPDERALAVHCHWTERRPWLVQHLIHGSANAQATCPRFLRSDETISGDERRRLDNGLSERYRAKIAARRLELLTFLDSAARQLPGDTYIAGQRVRLALDAGDLEDATAAAQSCSDEPTQCGLLQGLVLYRRGHVASADSTFAVAASRMSPDIRCAWNNVGMLLDDETRQKYEQMSCAAQAELEARLWWLADPLWLEAGNERRAEHFARKASIALIVLSGEDGRQRFATDHGGQSVIESLVRYGWPSQMFWGGPQMDRGHDQYLTARRASTAKPYVVPEYTRAGRLHTLPLASGLDDPFAATREAWQLSAPKGDRDWWPKEHYARDKSAIVELPVGQTVMLRRRDSTRFVWAGDLDSAARGSTIDSERQAVVFDSRAAGDVRRVASFSLHDGTRAIVDVPLAQGKTLLGIEVPGDSTHAAARTRYAVDVDAPLSMSAGVAALSQPLLFDAPADAMRSVETDQAIEHMYASTTLRDAGRMGVYWETYGFLPTDTLDLSIRITREDRPNALVRAIHAIGIGDVGDNDVAIRWRELPTNSRAIQQLEGAFPIQLRSIVLEVSRLPHGRYVLQVSVHRPNAEAVSSERRFELR